MANFSVSGLASGIDFSALADAIIQLERAPITQLETRRDQAKMKRDMYVEIQNALKSLQTASQNLAKPKSIAFATGSSSSESKLGIGVGESAAVGTYSVNIEQLATATRVTSGFATQLGLSASANLGVALNTAGSNLGSTFTDGYFTINGTTVSVNAATDTVQNLIDRINSQVSGVTASYDAATDKLKLTSAAAMTVGAADDTSDFLRKAGLTNSPDTLVGPDHVRTATHRLGRLNTSTALASASLGTGVSGTGSFKVNGVTVTYDASSDSLNDVISRINTKVSGVVASYDSQTDRILVVSKSTGSLGISRADVSGNFLQAAGLLDSGGDSAAQVSLGQNARITIPGHNNGNPIYSTSNTVSDAIPGVSLTLKETTTSAVTVSVSRSSSDLKSKVRGFVQAYNDAINLMHTRSTEEPIENAASASLQRVGLLRGDNLLAATRNKLAGVITSAHSTLPVGFNRLGNLGITLDKANVKIGTLAFDETQFDRLFEENFEAAYDILFADADGDGTVDAGEKGVLPAMLTELDNLLSETNKTFGGRSMPIGRLPHRKSTLGDEMEYIDERIEVLEARLAEREKSLRAQYVAAERAISGLKNQLSGISAFNQSRGTLGFG